MRTIKPFEFIAGANGYVESAAILWDALNHFEHYRDHLRVPGNWVIQTGCDKSAFPRYTPLDINRDDWEHITVAY